MGVDIRIRICLWVPLILAATLAGQNPAAFSYIYTHAIRYDPDATLSGGERFPGGATYSL